MKRNLVILLAVSLFAVAAPAMAAEMHQHGSQQTMDEQCVKDCDLLLKNCALEVDSIQQRIAKLQAAIKTQGADANSVQEVRRLKDKLEEANELLRNMEKGGK